MLYADVIGFLTMSKGAFSTALVVIIRSVIILDLVSWALSNDDSTFPSYDNQ